MLAALFAPLALAGPPAWVVRAGPLTEAIGAPGAGGGALFTGPIHPGFTAGVERPLGVAGPLSVPFEALAGLVHHAGYEDALSVTIGLAPRASIGPVRLELPAVGGGWWHAWRPGGAWMLGEGEPERSGRLGASHATVFGGVGLGAQLSDEFGLMFRYRVSIETAPGAIYQTPVMPHSTLGMDLAVALPGRAR